MDILIIGFVFEGLFVVEVLMVFCELYGIVCVVFDNGLGLEMWWEFDVVMIMLGGVLVLLLLVFFL